MSRNPTVCIAYLIMLMFCFVLVDKKSYTNNVMKYYATFGICLCLLLSGIITTPLLAQTTSGTSCIRATTIIRSVRAAVVTAGIFDTADTLCIRRAGDINKDSRADYSVTANDHSVTVVSRVGGGFVVADPVSSGYDANRQSFAVKDVNFIKSFAVHLGKDPAMIQQLTRTSDINGDGFDDYTIFVNGCPADVDTCSDGRYTLVLVSNARGRHEIAQDQSGGNMLLTRSRYKLFDNDVQFHPKEKRIVQLYGRIEQWYNSDGQDMGSALVSCEWTIHEWNSEKRIFDTVLDSSGHTYCAGLEIR